MHHIQKYHLETNKNRELFYKEWREEWKIYQISVSLFLCLIIEEKIPVIFHLKNKISYSSLIVYQMENWKTNFILGEWWWKNIFFILLIFKNINWLFIFWKRENQKKKVFDFKNSHHSYKKLNLLKLKDSFAFMKRRTQFIMWLLIKRGVIWALKLEEKEW